ncbi:methionine synthase (B12-dependent) [gut metagenome]|uniref:Methionine synthase (B12-dependent) n=1 Tax=gut metagenome TaxID=749906 RepID=J9GVV4_9ZZZZ
MIISYQIHEVAPYINWIYFFHAWGFQPRFANIAQIHGCDACRAMWLSSFPTEERGKAAEAMQLFKEAGRILVALEEIGKEMDSEMTDANEQPSASFDKKTEMANKGNGNFRIKTMVKLLPANADGDDLLITKENGEKMRFPLLRQQVVKREQSPFLCLSDYIRPLSSGFADRIGVFASTVDPHMEQMYADDPYKHLLVQTLSDRLAEAATEKMHERVRKEVWGYAPNEDLSIPDLLIEKYQGIRPAVGYPSLPDQSVNFLLDELMDMKQIGISLTENGAMHPHASVCGLMFAHPAAEYFSVGKIGKDQLEDYARRRGMSVNNMRRFLAANLQ